MGEWSIVKFVLSCDSEEFNCLIVTGRKLSFLTSYAFELED